MIRKILFIILMCVGVQFIISTNTQAQTRDSIAINMPPYTDTTCFGTQLTFYAIPTSDTFTGVTFKWFTNGIYTGVVNDTFYTTALITGDNVYCKIYFTNSLGNADSFQSNTITIYRVATMPANVLIYLIAGVNPSCRTQPLTFEAYPINGGTNPIYQWYINRVPVFGEDSNTISRYFSSYDSVYCKMISNSPCAPWDTVYSDTIPVVQVHYYAALTITALHDSVCQGRPDTIISNLAIPVDGAHYQWFRNSFDTIRGAIAYTYIADTLHNGDSIFCGLFTGDTCVLNHYSFSNGIKIKIRHVFNNASAYGISSGVNPGCLDSFVTFTLLYDSFGTPTISWYKDSVLFALDTNKVTDTFRNNDSIYIRVTNGDLGCYVHDTMYMPLTVMIRDTAPPAPLISLIGDQIVANTAGTYEWFGPYPSGIIAGATGKIYNPSSRGWYYCIKIADSLHREYYCPSQPSNSLYVSLLGIDKIFEETIQIFPNPTTGIIEMDWNGHKVNASLDIYNMIGQKVRQEHIVNEMSHITDLSGLPIGTYLMVFRDEYGNSYNYKVELNK